ncbi:MAG: GGDEF domain-containing protein [Microthrixaceae bacterium]
MDRTTADLRVLAALLGVIGSVLGIAGAASDLPWLVAAAGLAAVAACVLLVLSARHRTDEPAPAAVSPSGSTGSTGSVADTPAVGAAGDPIMINGTSPTGAVTGAVTGAATAAEVEELRARLASAEERVAELEGSTPARPAAGRPVVDGIGGAHTAATLTDPESQLFSEAYFHVALGSRLASARRHLRPVAVALVQVAEGLAAEGTADAPPARIAESIRETVREADIACRLDDGTFAVILEDTPENGAVWTVERIRRNLVSRFGSHTMWAGVACYPAHAFGTDELVDQARGALVAAQEWKQDRIEVAISE